jgi:hypothetical protein
MDPDARDPSKLSAWELLIEYRKHLPPGVYYFIGKNEEDRPVDIIEIHVPLSGQSKQSGHEVVFGFFEKGCPTSDLNKKDLTQWRHHYPFTHHITSTSSEFQEKLAVHIRARLLHGRERTGTKTAADQ